VLIGTYRQYREKNIEALNKMDDTALDERPKNVPPAFEDSMRTAGQALLISLPFDGLRE
jgi:hypothetical protein